MYTYKHENITLNVEHIDPNWVEITGETYVDLEWSALTELLEDSCTFLEFWQHDDGYELMEDNDDDLDSVIEYIKSEKKGTEIRNADCIIAIYEYFLDTEEEVSFNVRTENVSWVIHDMLHAKHDAAGCTIYVESNAERDRITESMHITKELFPSALPDYEFLTNLEVQFKARFRENLDLSDFYELEEYYDENY